jgi:hypothetical protein
MGPFLTSVFADVLYFMLQAGRSGDQVPVGAGFFPTRPDRSWGSSSPVYNGYLLFPGGKVALRGVTWRYVALTTHPI